MNSNNYEMYLKAGISKEVLDFCKEIEDDLKERFAKIDEVAEYNQLKVILAMQKNQVSEAHLGTSTGYGHFQNEHIHTFLHKLLPKIPGWSQWK